VTVSGAEVGSVLMQFLELEATFARSVGEHFDFTVIRGATAVEHDRGNARGLGLEGEGNAERLRAGDVGLELLLAQFGVEAAEKKRAWYPCRR